MIKKNVLYALFLVGLMAIFAYMVLGFDDINVVEPAADTNHSGSLVVNATVNNDTAQDNNATNITFNLYNSTGDLVYNVTEVARNLDLNDSFNTTIDTTSFPDGFYNLTVNATNTTGDENWINESVTNIQFDNTAPLVTINAPTANTFIGSDPTTLVFNVTIIDAGVGIDTVNLSNSSVGGDYTYAQKIGNDYNLTILAANLTEGSNTLTVWVNDTLGNLNNSETVVVWLDTTAPTVDLISPNNWTWTTDTTPSLTFNFTDENSPNGTCEIFVDGATAAANLTTLNNTGTGIILSPTLSLGTHTWGANCTDLGGNVGMSDVNYTIDVVSPVNVSTPGDTSWTNEVRNGTDGVDFTFNFVSGFTSEATNNISCELWITNASGVFLANGVNTTALNNTPMTIKNNQTLVNGLATNWTINCTYNGTDITQKVDDGYFTLNVDNATPTVTVASSDVSTTTATLTASTNEVATCRYSATDVGWASMYEFETTGGVTSHSTSLVSLSSGTGYTYYVRCQDRADNEVYGSESFTTTSVTGGGGAGGSGSGISTGITSQFAQKTWASINAGETATIEVANSEIGVTEVSFAVEDTTHGAWVKVQKVDTLPSTVESYGGKTYKNIKISETNVEKVMKDKATIKFKVAKSWLTENKIGQANVALFRFADDKWNELATTVGQDDGTYVHYSAETLGFSYFVIGEKVGAPEVVTEEAAAEEAAEEAAAAEEVEEVVAKEPAKKKTWLWALPIVAALAVIVWLVWFRKK